MAWRDGTCGVLLDPLDFLARLAALIPPPKFHMLRYHGVLAAHAKDRARVVPGFAPESPALVQLGLAFGKMKKLGVEPDTKGSTRHPWADLMQRVFAHEVLVCQRCKGDMRLVEVINDSDELARALAEAGLGSRPPPRPRPSPPGQHLLDFAA